MSDVGKRTSIATTSVISDGHGRRSLQTLGWEGRVPAEEASGTRDVMAYWNVAAFSLVTISVPVSTLGSTVSPFAAL